MISDPEIPDFKTEEEEGDWLATHQDVLLAMFQRAEKDGRLTRGSTARNLKTQSTTIRLNPKDIEIAREQAEKRGLRYQTYLKMIIHQALLQEDAKQ